jgi:hypothetical protein
VHPVACYERSRRKLANIQEAWDQHTALDEGDISFLIRMAEQRLYDTDTQTGGHFYGIIDPDYAKVFTVARCIAWSEGYALLMHGSFTRDLDLLAVPWAEQATDPDHLIRRIAFALDDLDILVKDPEAETQSSEKPHGRRAWTLTFKAFGDPRFIDISVMPRGTRPTGSTGATSPESTNRNEMAETSYPNTIGPDHHAEMQARAGRIRDGIRGGNATGTTSDMLRAIAESDEIAFPLHGGMERPHLRERAGFLDMAESALTFLWEDIEPHLAAALSRSQQSPNYSHDNGEPEVSAELSPDAMAMNFEWVKTEIIRLRQGIQDMLNGNYPHPRAYRPGKCPHDVWYFDECPSCDEAHLQAVLAPSDRSHQPQPAGEEPTGSTSAPHPVGTNR